MVHNLSYIFLILENIWSLALTCLHIFFSLVSSLRVTTVELPEVKSNHVPTSTTVTTEENCSIVWFIRKLWKTHYFFLNFSHGQYGFATILVSYKPYCNLQQQRANNSDINPHPKLSNRFSFPASSHSPTSPRWGQNLFDITLKSWKHLYKIYCLFKGFKVAIWPIYSFFKGLHSSHLA